MDKRVRCICTKSADGTQFLQHVVIYVIEHDTQKRQISVTVKASEMTNPADENELKTKADIKAAAIKAAWVAKLVIPPLQVSTDTAVSGDVTL